MFSESGPAALLVQADDQGPGTRGSVHQGGGRGGHCVQAQGPLCHRAVHLRLPPSAQHQVRHHQVNQACHVSYHHFTLVSCHGRRRPCPPRSGISCILTPSDSTVWPPRHPMPGYKHLIIASSCQNNPSPVPSNARLQARWSNYILPAHQAVGG